MLPIEQTCPTCGIRFMGSDALGFPCLDCAVIENMEERKGRPLTDAEKAEVLNASILLENIVIGRLE